MQIFLTELMPIVYIKVSCTRDKPTQFGLKSKAITYIFTLNIIRTYILW